MLLLRFLRNLRLSRGALLGLFSLSPEFFKFFFTLAILAISLILSIFRYQETFLLLLRFLRNLRTILLQLAIPGEFVILAISDRACNPAHATEQMTNHVTYLFSPGILQSINAKLTFVHTASHRRRFLKVRGCGSKLQREVFSNRAILYLLTREESTVNKWKTITKK